MSLYTNIKFFQALFLIVVNSDFSESSTVGENARPPVIKLEHVGNSWQNITTSSAKTSLFSNLGDDLFLSCQASYPIRWNITGTILPFEVVKIQPPHRDFPTNVFEIKVNMFFLDAENLNSLIASALITCESVENGANREELAIFVKGNNPLVGQFESEVKDSRVVPCPTSDPTSPTSLYIKNTDESEALVQDATYNPIIGFESKDIFNGIYVCRKGAFSTTIFASKSDTKNEHEYFPQQSNVRRFTDEILEFKCSSKSKKVNLAFLPNNETTIVFTQTTDQAKAAQIAVATNVVLRDDTVIKGKVACLVDNDKTLVQEWSYELIKTPELYLDNIEGEADCLSGITPKMVQSVRCKNSMDCAFMSQCLRDPLFCNFKKQKQFYAQTDTYCWVDEQNKGRNCVSVPFSHLNGLVQCTVQGMTRRWEFFISLDYVRYSNWSEAPVRELVRLEELETQELSQNSTVLCTASAYLFADSLIFQLKYENGTTEFIKGQDAEKKFSRPSSQNPKRIYEMNVKAFLNMKLPVDVTSIDCIAPFWDSFDYLTATKKLRNRRMISPNLIRVSNENEKTFRVGEKNQELRCLSAKSQKIWQYAEDENMSYKMATDAFPELILRGSANDSLVLVFPTVDKKHAGNYQCVSFEDGQQLSIIETHKLNVSGDSQSSINATISGLVIALIIFAIIVLVGVVIFFRKLNKKSSTRS